MKINLFPRQNPCYARHDKWRGTCQGTSWSKSCRGGAGRHGSLAVIICIEQSSTTTLFNLQNYN